MSGTLHPPSSSQPIGTFNNIAYVRHKGKFTGTTACGPFAVPYEVTTPANPTEGNRFFVVEPPHFTNGFVARDGSLGPQFLFITGFSHIGVGYSNFRGRILDPAPPGFTPMICGQALPGTTTLTDYNILRQLALTLRENPPPFIGRVGGVYCIGVSDSGNTAHEIYKPFGHKLFDITFACLADYIEPVNIRGQKPIFVFNTEADFDHRAVPNPAFPQYRWYGVPGGPHIPDSVFSRITFPNPPPQGSTVDPVAGASPINWLLFIRALFIAGDQWARNGVQPPASRTLRVNAQGNIVRDAKGNALGGIRHPALETGEATFIASIIRGYIGGNPWDLFGAYSHPKIVNAAEFPAYLATFKGAADALLAARFLTPTAHTRLLREAQLSPPDTYTLNYTKGRLFPPPLSGQNEEID